MEASGQPQPPAAPERGALVLLNGRQGGTRRPLVGPVTFLGRDAGCELRLNVEEVEPFHCALAHGGGGVTVRDLGGPRGTFVNGQRVAAVALRDGDLLDVGPFRFRVLLPAAAPPPGDDRDALRVQAAAVAAQQAALDEAEARLDDQRRQLLDAAEQHRKDRAAWDEERELGRRQLDDRAARLDREQQRLAERDAVLAALQARLQESEGALAVRQVQSNTERELDSRLLADGLRRLEEDRRRWRERRGRETAALRGRWVKLIEGERQLARARARLVREAQVWEAQQHVLQAELQGLNSRIVHQRQKLDEQEQALQGMAPRPADPDTPPADPALAARAHDLDRLAGALADQRAELVEQWERLARLHEAWQAERDEAAAGLEALARRLAEQDDSLEARAREAAAREARLRQGEEQLDRLRREMGATHARLRAERQASAAEHEQVMEDARRLAEDARRQLERLGELRRQWNQKRRREVESLRAERGAIARQREELDGIGLDLEKQALRLEEGRRALEEDALALERRGEDGDDGQDALARQIAHLRRRWLAQNEELLRSLQGQREAIKKELEDLDRVRQELASRADRLTREEAEAREHETALQFREAQLAADRARLEQERLEGEGRRRLAERRLAALEEEAESLARALLPDADRPPEPLERAA